MRSHDLLEHAKVVGLAGDHKCCASKPGQGVGRTDERVLHLVHVPAHRGDVKANQPVSRVLPFGDVVDDKLWFGARLEEVSWFRLYRTHNQYPAFRHPTGWYAGLQQFHSSSDCSISDTSFRDVNTAGCSTAYRNAEAARPLTISHQLFGICQNLPACGPDADSSHQASGSLLSPLGDGDRGETQVAYRERSSWQAAYQRSAKTRAMRLRTLAKEFGKTSQNRPFLKSSRTLAKVKKTNGSRALRGLSQAVRNASSRSTSRTLRARKSALVTTGATALWTRHLAFSSSFSTRRSGAWSSSISCAGVSSLGGLTSNASACLARASSNSNFGSSNRTNSRFAPTPSASAPVGMKGRLLGEADTSHPGQGDLGAHQFTVRRFDGVNVTSPHVTLSAAGTIREAA